MGKAAKNFFVIIVQLHENRFHQSKHFNVVTVDIKLSDSMFCLQTGDVGGRFGERV